MDGKGSWSASPASLNNVWLKDIGGVCSQNRSSMPQHAEIILANKRFTAHVLWGKNLSMWTTRTNAQTPWSPCDVFLWSPYIILYQQNIPFSSWSPVWATGGLDLPRHILHEFTGYSLGLVQRHQLRQCILQQSSKVIHSEGPETKANFHLGMGVKDHWRRKRYRNYMTSQYMVYTLLFLGFFGSWCKYVWIVLRESGSMEERVSYVYI